MNNIIKIDLIRHYNTKINQNRFKDDGVTNNFTDKVKLLLMRLYSEYVRKLNYVTLNSSYPKRLIFSAPVTACCVVVNKVRP